MKITRFEIVRVPPSWVWLKIHTYTELVGLGEPYLENHPESVIAEVQRLEPLLVGKDPCRVEELWQLMYKGGSGYVGGPVKMSAISGASSTGTPSKASTPGSARRYWRKISLPRRIK